MALRSWWIGLAVSSLALVRVAHAQDGTPFLDDPAPSTSRLPPPSGAPSTRPAGEAAPVEPTEPPPPPDLPEEPGAPFGSRGSLALSTTAGASGGGTWYSNSNARSAGFALVPEADFFVVRNVSIGLTADLSYSVTRGYGADGSLIETRGAGVYVGPRFGLNLRISDLLSFYPSVSFGLEWRHLEQEIVAGTSISLPNPLGSPQTTQTGFWIEAFAPLLLHVRPHAFVGIGPSFFHEFARATEGPDVGGERTTLGARIVVGGHFGGRSAAAPPASPTRPARRFGDDHVVVLAPSGAFSWTGYGGTDSSVTGLSLNAFVDYFVGYRFSIGAGAGFGYAAGQGIDPTNGAAVTSRRISVGGAVRVGYDLEVNDRLSIYPLVSFGARFEGYDYVEGSARNRSQDLVAYGSLFVPVLFHVAPHLRIGAGPYVDHDFARQSERASSSKPNLATDFGASVYVGIHL